MEAFTELLHALPPDTGMGFVLVQHLDPQHESALPQLLARTTRMPVLQVTQNLRVDPNHVYVIPKNAKLTIRKGVLKLGPRTEASNPLRPIDGFFESLSQDQGERAIGVVLSGTANDGTLGLEAIKAEGGITFAQDRSAKYESMPRSAVAAGCVDLVLPPAGISMELARIARHPYVAGVPAAVSPPPQAREPSPARSRGRHSPEDDFQTILALLLRLSAVDFSLYKPSTIQRRITRRMVLGKHESLADYAAHLRDTPAELKALYSDVLISVTSFFRNSEAFELLQRKLLPRLLQQPGDDPIRVWVLGCSTGQEAYSIAMAFAEAADRKPGLRKLQVFATDLNEALLERARQGLYPRGLAHDVSPQRLRRFFVEEEGGYRVNKAIRERVVFARHDLVSDPPLSRMDLISCRNLLIYLEPETQRKVFPTFHYALKPGGYLFLGASESIGGFTDLFAPVDKKQKLFSRKPASRGTMTFPIRKKLAEETPPTERTPFRREALPESVSVLQGGLSVEREADRLMINQFAPPGVLISADFQVLQFRGATGEFLEPPTGRASFDLLKMAREGLMLPLRYAINRAKREHKNVRKDGIRLPYKGGERRINLEVFPLRNASSEPCFLVLFHDPDRTPVATPATRAQSKSPPQGRDRQARRVSELETELLETKDYLQSVQEQHETTSERLQASSEEVQSANEELQSINEELETSKEELESANEELNTVNEELVNRNLVLGRLNSDLVNLQNSTHVAMVLVTRDLCIRRFNSSAERLLGLKSSDIGRPIGNLRHDFEFSEPSTEKPAARQEVQATELERRLAEVIDQVREAQYMAQDRKGHWFSVRIRPYITVDNEVDGAVLVLVDVDQMKRDEATITASRDYAEAVTQTTREPLVVLGRDLRVFAANKAFCDMFGVAPEQIVGKLLSELGNHQWDIPRLQLLLERIIPDNSRFEGYEVTEEFEGIGRRTVLLNARLLQDVSSGTERILLGIQDLTEQMEYQGTLRENKARYQALVEATSQIVWTTDPMGAMFEDSPSWRAFTGQSLEQSMGFGWLDALHPEDRDRTLARWKDAVKQGTTLSMEYRLHHLRDGWRWTSVHAVPVRNPDGSLRIWVGMNTDITERRLAEDALRRSEEALRQMADVMPQIVWMAKADGRVDYFNQRWYEFTGFSGGDRLESWDSILHPDDAERSMRHYHESIRSGRPYQSEFRFRDRTRGGYRWFMGRALPIRNEEGQVLRWFGTCTDIDDQKQLEEELAGRIEELGAIDAAKGEFFAILSHELRQPLNAIRGWLQILNRPGIGEDDRRKALEVIDRNSLAQSHLIGDLLDAHRISAGRVVLELEVLEFRAELEASIAAVEPALRERGIHLDREDEGELLSVHGDARRLQQVLGNLLSNALKFTPPQGRIRISLRRVGTWAELAISDTGQGIGKEALPHVFDLFRQGQSQTSGGHAGLGLGLSIARQLVELHGGSVTASSAGKGAGSTFTIMLPIRGADSVAAPSVRTSSAIADPSNMLGGVMVLVVDDEPDAREPVRRVLESAGAEVIAVASAEEALETLHNIRPDVLVSDIAMPGDDGYALLRKVRSLSAIRGGRIPAIALTAFGASEDREKARAAGFNSHLTKPVEPATLIVAVSSLLHPSTTE